MQKKTPDPLKIPLKIPWILAKTGTALQRGFVRFMPQYLEKLPVAPREAGKGKVLRNFYRDREERLSERKGRSEHGCVRALWPDKTGDRSSRRKSGCAEPAPIVKVKMVSTDQEKDPQAKFREEYKAYLWDLFHRAQEKDGFNFVLTLLRFHGMSIGHWDPMVEAHEALSDLSELIRQAAQDQDRAKRLYRLGLLVYCHATEMSAPYEILYNILNCVQGANYQMSPFADLIRPKNKKNKGFFTEVILPSPRAKIEKLREKCKIVQELKLIELFDSFFRQEIRNAFYHSDYCINLDKRTFNVTEVRFGKSIPLEEINEILVKGFAFYEAFFQTYYGWRFVTGKVRRFHRWPGYEVLELLSNEEEGLYGFTVHISNGTRCTFERHKDRVIAENVMFEKEGLSLHVGLLDDLREEWIVRGEPYREPMDRDRYNENGEWKPIVYPAPTDKIQAEIRAVTEDPRKQGCLF